MKKRIFAALVCIVVVFSVILTSCGSKKYDINIHSLSGDLDALFSDQLTELTSQAIGLRYGCDNLYDDVTCKVSSTISADEFVVFTAKDEKSADEIFEKLENYKKERIELYKTYAADEISKLENALLEKAGKYVVFVASSDADDVDAVWKKYIA